MLRKPLFNMTPNHAPFETPVSFPPKKTILFFQLFLNYTTRDIALKYTQEDRIIHSYHTSIPSNHKTTALTSPYPFIIPSTHSYGLSFSFSDAHFLHLSAGHQLFFSPVDHSQYYKHKSLWSWMKALEHAKSCNDKFKEVLKKIKKDQTETEPADLDGEDILFFALCKTIVKKNSHISFLSPFSISIQGVLKSLIKKKKIESSDVQMLTIKPPPSKPYPESEIPFTKTVLHNHPLWPLTDYKGNVSHSKGLILTYNYTFSPTLPVSKSGLLSLFSKKFTPTQKTKFVCIQHFVDIYCSEGLDLAINAEFELKRTTIDNRERIKVTIESMEEHMNRNIAKMLVEDLSLNEPLSLLQSDKEMTQQFASTDKWCAALPIKKHIYYLKEFLNSSFMLSLTHSYYLFTLYKMSQKDVMDKFQLTPIVIRQEVLKTLQDLENFCGEHMEVKASYEKEESQKKVDDVLENSLKKIGERLEAVSSNYKMSRISNEVGIKTVHAWAITHQLESAYSIFLEHWRYLSLPIRSDLYKTDAFYN